MQICSWRRSKLIRSNAGWIGKPAGQEERIKIAYSRAVVGSILNGSLNRSEFERDPLFWFMVPKQCEGVPAELLNPRNSTSDLAAYEERARKLVADFKQNFTQFENGVPKEVLYAMP